MTITDGVYEDYVSGKNSFAKKFSANIFTEDGEKTETNSDEDFFEKNAENNEFWWCFAINAVILAIIVLMIVVFNIRELEPYVEQIQSAPHHTVYLKESVNLYCLPVGLCHNFGPTATISFNSQKCAMNFDRPYLTQLLNSTNDIPLSSQSTYTPNLLLESSAISQLIRNLTCEYLPDHKAMT